MQKTSTIKLGKKVFLGIILAILAFSSSLFAQPGGAILLQGFNWESHKHNWYTVLNNNAATIQNAKFNGIWLPPSSDSGDPHGYLPRQLNNLNSRYGTQTALTNLITNFRNRNVRVIADIVINHRVGTTGWGDFTNPTWGCWAVTRNDEWSGTCGTNNDSGENYHAARDLDHANATVRSEIIKWMRWMKNTIRFDGWRYDYVKGYWGGYNKIYNDNTTPWISIGELWTDLDYNNVNAHRQRIINWIDATGGTSTAFDFTTKGVLQHAIRRNEYWRLRIDGKAAGVIGWWPAKAVTFIDNHDTGSTQGHWPFPGDNEKVLQGYAYILTHPGIPMVFWDHYFDWGATHRNRIQALIDIRKSMGITSTSSLSIQRAETGLYAAIIAGKVAMKIGPNSWSPGTGWTLRTSGINYAVWTKNGADALDGEEAIDDHAGYALSLDQNYPNPANGSTTIPFVLPNKQHASVKLYNAMGNEVAVLANGEYEEGRHELNVDLGSIKPGIYTYRLVSAGESLTKRLVVK
jgi:alpha-amylase